jgi:hypothetical protein
MHGRKWKVTMIFVLVYTLGQMAVSQGYQSEDAMLAAVPSFLQQNATCVLTDEDVRGLAISQNGFVDYGFADLNAILPQCDNVPSVKYSETASILYTFSIPVEVVPQDEGR